MKRENRERRDKDQPAPSRRDREGRERRDRDRHRDRGSRRDRDRDFNTAERNTASDSITGTNLNIHGPVVLLKRPDAAGGSAPAGSSTSDRNEQLKTTESRQDSSQSSQQSSGSKPTAILTRSAAPKKGSLTDVRSSSSVSAGSTASVSTAAEEVKVVKPKVVTGQSIGSIKPKYKFPFDSAVPILNATKDATVETDLQFVSANSNLTDFFVITALGVPQAGKSSILSFLGSEDSEFGERLLFLPRKGSERKEGFVYMTSSRIILLEMPSVFNGAAVNDMMSLMGREGTLENAAMSWNLRMVIWALSVSHLVIIVSEDLVAPNLLQLINTASMIHPAESVFGEDAYPELIYACNKAEHSLLEDRRALEAAQSIFASVLTRPSRISQNFFVLPHTKWSKSHKDDFENLRLRVDDFVRYNRATLVPELAHVKKFPQTLSIGEWLGAAKRVWEDVAQHSSFHAYMKLLP